MTDIFVFGVQGVMVGGVARFYSLKKPQAQRLINIAKIGKFVYLIQNSYM